MRLSVFVQAATLAAIAITIPTMAAAQGRQPAEVRAAAHQDVSPPLRDMPTVRTNTVQGGRLALPLPRPAATPAGALAPLQSLQPRPSLGPNAATTAGLNFDGIGQGFVGPAGTFTVSSAPPDTIGAVGATQYVQAVNSEFAVFDKTSGSVVFGPVPLNTLWSGFGGGCEANNDGDPIVAYDKQANRWIISQFSVSTTPFLQCVAVSTTSDATGTYARYSFSYTGFNDYPKLGVWPDAYYITYNRFNTAGTAFLGAQVCALDRAKMLAGTAATQQCFLLPSSFGGLLPADLDGATPPPAGAPSPLVALGATANTLATWKLHVDWATPANTTLTGPTVIAVPSFSEACGTSGTCIPQLGTFNQLDSLSDRLMHRLAYRNFGDHEAVVVNHAVTAGTSVGIRWYELRSPTTTPTLFQTGVIAPDSQFRWMGSIAMDKAGNIAVGYSVSSSLIKPGIRYSGRLVGDAAGAMTFEASIFEGAGAQTGTLSRWGDYSAMTLDPTDDCTFFYTNQYIPIDGTFNWKTRIASFKFPSCGVVADFGLAASPTSLSVQQGQSGTSTISTSVVSGSPGVVNLSVSGVPAGATAAISPVSVSAGASATLTFNAGAAVPGLYTLTVTGTAEAKTHTTPVSVTVLAPPPPDFGLSASPTSLGLLQGQSGASVISTQVVGSSGTVVLSVSGVPAGASASLSPNSVTAGASSTLTFNAGTAAPGTYVVTITGLEGAITHATTVSVTIGAAVVSDFSISSTPAALTAPRGSTVGTTIATAVTAGSAGTVTLSLAGVPTRARASLSPTSVTAGGSSTLTIDLGRTARGTYLINVTGVEGSKTHTTTVTLTVTRR